MNKKKGFSLTELLIVMAIIAIMVAIFTGAINPIAQINKVNDSRRKKDLNRIKISFEDYYNDNNCYPNQMVIDQLMTASNCGEDMFAPWLRDWPCDPVSKQPYRIVIEGSTDCPDWFKIYANLENRRDKDILEGWYNYGEFYRFGDGTLTISDANYGGSSSNVIWYEPQLNPACGEGCSVEQGGTPCQDAGICFPFEGNVCYQGLSCIDGCQVESCGL